jgi:hypothetical protein
MLNNFKLIFVYITNASIPKKTNKIMETNVPIVFIDQRSLEESSLQILFAAARLGDLRIKKSQN